MNINFVCPECGGIALEEIMTGVSLCSAIEGISATDGESVEVDCSQSSWEGGEIDRYQCAGCGHVAAITTRDLLAFLKEHDMINEPCREGANAMCGEIGHMARKGGSVMGRCTTAAVYYENGKPLCYSLFREGQPVVAKPIRGIRPTIVTFEEAYGLFAVIRVNFTADGLAIEE